MRDLHNTIAHAIVATPKTIANVGSPEDIVSGDIDLQGFEAAEIVAMVGEIDELGTSPVGAAKIEMLIEHADDDGTGAAGAYADVAIDDVIGPSSVAGGVVATTVTDQTFLEVGYKGGRRFVRVTLRPTGLSNGGLIAAWVTKGIPRHAPQ